MWTGFESDNPPSAQRYWNPYVHTNQGSKTYEDRFGCDVFVDFLIDFMTRHKDQSHDALLPHGVDPWSVGQHAGRARRDREDGQAQSDGALYTDAALGRLVAALDELQIRNNTIVIWSTDNGTSGGVSGRMNGRLVRGGKAKLTEKRRLRTVCGQLPGPGAGRCRDRCPDRFQRSAADLLRVGRSKICPRE